MKKTKTLSIAAVFIANALAGCTATKIVKDTVPVNASNSKNTMSIEMQADATSLEDTVFIRINGAEKFRFVFNMGNTLKTLSKDAEYNGDRLKASCKLDLSSKKTTLTYTAHNCSVYVNGDLAINREF